MEQELFTQDLLTRLAKMENGSTKSATDYHLSKRITIYIEEKAKEPLGSSGQIPALSSSQKKSFEILEQTGLPEPEKTVEKKSCSIGCQTDFVPFFPMECLPFKLTPEKWSQLLTMNGLLGHSDPGLKTQNVSFRPVLGKREFKEKVFEPKISKNEGFRKCVKMPSFAPVKKLVIKKEVGSVHSSDSETIVKKKGKKIKKKILIFFRLLELRRGQ